MNRFFSIILVFCLSIACMEQVLTTEIRADEVIEFPTNAQVWNEEETSLEKYIPITTFQSSVDKPHRRSKRAIPLWIVPAISWCISTNCIQGINTLVQSALRTPGKWNMLWNRIESLWNNRNS
ncbi:MULTISPECIES: hypothetical protein [Erysipelothrix]|uniref:Uncharacterized protein n=1 Tax=Erysipelothrix rhusiopathiae ATCC 19414 TaxID=525280 RepID=E7FVD1_ERYRH|nr:hypothetical protein [Erysipelothrix rhusiopathiae]EFY08851.1 hypothetical protein HMPREF0357_10958 [Erysipelothrix rhusiopathiae ATCC 19414]MDE8037879.1 hypothetical protein [Erysipelothrix rhusiopathiae]MDE8062007.1 hypothetical protein [Erysipelothrix rhusiopathiae]MDE8257962.1 hypothetical protein [Erysipelothrix rhusiopathiae]MDE9424013.1 hypothetical protein [Erysipelothrix rhusiopathiae]